MILFGWTDNPPGSQIFSVVTQQNHTEMSFCVVLCFSWTPSVLNQSDYTTALVASHIWQPLSSLVTTATKL
jgi:hypothetical protein